MLLRVGIYRKPDARDLKMVIKNDFKNCPALTLLLPQPLTVWYSSATNIKSLQLSPSSSSTRYMFVFKIDLLIVRTFASQTNCVCVCVTALKTAGASNQLKVVHVSSVNKACLCTDALAERPKINSAAMTNLVSCTRHLEDSANPQLALLPAEGGSTCLLAVLSYPFCYLFSW